MAEYYLNEAVFDLTETFVDKTMHRLEAKLPGDAPVGVFVHRRPIERGKSVREVVDENVALNNKRLIAYRVLEKTEADVGGFPGILLRTSWRHEGTVFFYQLQAHVALEGKHMSFVVSGPLDEQAACDETFESILRTITWRSEGDET